MNIATKESPFRFQAGQNKILDGTIDPVTESEKYTGLARRKWRYDRLKNLIRTKPAGHLFQNEEVMKVMGFRNQPSFIAFRSTKPFLKEFVMTKNPTGGIGYSYAIKSDAKLQKKFEPTYKKPEVVVDKGELKAPATDGIKTLNDTDAFFALAKQAAVDKLARELTVGEVMDYAAKNK